MLLYNIAVVKIRQYIEVGGSSPFEKWFLGLNSIAAAKITKALYKLELGNFSTVEGVSSGVYEQKIDFGPGYRIYFGKDGSDIVILLCGGTKKRQSTDIAKAKKYWLDYKQRKHVR
jgi:putative addiction module killer protein